VDLRDGEDTNDNNKKNGLLKYSLSLEEQYAKVLPIEDQKP
jgi:hypothetical protein